MPLLVTWFDQCCSRFHVKVVVSDASNDIFTVAAPGSSQNAPVIKVVMGVFRNQTLANKTFHTFLLSDNSNMKIFERICQCYVLKMNFWYFLRVRTLLESVNQCFVPSKMHLE